MVKPTFLRPPHAAAVPFGSVVTKSRLLRVREILVAVLLGSSGPATAAGGSLFAAPFLSFDTGTNPSSVAIGDLNGDGTPDLVVANYNAYTPSYAAGGEE